MSDQNRVTICVSNPNHFYSLVGKMAQLRANDSFTDVILQVDNVDIAAHKIVLAMGSPFFERMLQDVYAENKMTKIPLCHETNPAIIMNVLDFIYSRPICFGKEDCGLLLRNFDYFQMESAKKECENAIVGMVDAGNCIEMLIVADQVALTSLFQRASKVILNYFNQINESDDIKRLTKAQLQTVLDIVTSRYPDAVFQTILAWVKYDENNRRSYFPELLWKYVHIEKVLREQRVMQDIGAELLRSLFSISNMYIFSTKAHSPVYEFNPKINSLSQFVNEAGLDNFSVTKWRESIYVIGGEANGQCVNDGFKFDINRRIWTNISCPTLRNQSGVCVGNDKMYIAGGWRDQSACHLFSNYDFETGILNALPEIMFSRWSPGVAFINSSIYILGGYPSGRDTTPKSTIERFDPREGKLFIVGEIPIGEIGCTAVSFEDKIFYKGWNTSLHDFDPRNGLSKVVKEFNAFGTITVSDGQLYLAHESGVSSLDRSSGEFNDIFLTSLCTPFIIA